MNPLLQLVLSLSLGGSLMALLVLGIQWMLRGKLPSAFYYCAWLAVLLRLVLPLPGFMSLEGGREEAAPAAVYDTTEGSIPHVGDLDRLQSEVQQEIKKGQYANLRVKCSYHTNKPHRGEHIVLHTFYTGRKKISTKTFVRRIKPAKNSFYPWASPLLCKP